MGVCKVCKRYGVFLKTDKVGMCATCHQVALIEIPNRARIIADSAYLTNTGKSLETRLSRLSTLLEHARFLYEKYEKNGIVLGQPTAEEYLRDYQGKDAEITADWLKDESLRVKNKVETAATPSARIGALAKYAMTAGDILAKHPDNQKIVLLEQKARKNLSDAQYQDLMIKARNLEFKGQMKKALEKYYEALYFIRNDNVDDELQKGSLKEVEKKIRELGGEI